MNHFTRIATGVDITPLLAELDAAPDMWFVDTSRQRKVRCQRHTRNIFLRAPRKPLPPGAKNANDVHESRVAPAATRFPRTLGYCERVADALGGTLGRATLVTLLPRSRVFPHVDAGAYYRVRDRLHLVLRSPGGSPLWAGDETVVMRTGELWAFDNKARHWAENPSDEPRMHLIFDLLPAPGRGFHVLPPENADRARDSRKRPEAIEPRPRRRPSLASMIVNPTSTPEGPGHDATGDSDHAPGPVRRVSKRIGRRILIAAARAWAAESTRTALS